MSVFLADGHCGINVHLGPAWETRVARASQSQVKAGVSAVVENCMRNEPRPRGGAVQEISEHYALSKHGLSNTTGKAMMASLQSGSGSDLAAKTSLRVTAECERTQKHHANRS